MKQHERFSQYLNDAITSAGLYKNEMIRALEIDRSSFFQIVRGSRLPTKEQYQKLKKILLLPKEESRQLDDAYYREVLGEEIWEDIQHVCQFLQLLSEVEQESADQIREKLYVDARDKRPAKDGNLARYLKSSTEVEEGIAHIFQEMHRTKELDFYMPAFGKSFFRLLKQQLSSADEVYSIRQLVGLSGGRVSDRKEAAGAFSELLTFMSLRNNIHLECHYYYNAVSKVSDIGLLYPWYVLCGSCVLFISYDLCSGILCDSEELAHAYSDRFEKAFEESTPMLKSYGALEQNLRAVREFLKGKREVNYEAIPCTAMIATPQMIRKYVIPQAQEELIAHCQTLQQEETMIDLASLSGLRKFLVSRKIPEIPDALMQPADVQDLIWYMDILLDRLGDTLFIIDESKIPVVYDWDITIIEELSVLIHHHNYDTMIIEEKNIVDMFTSFAVSIMETPFIMETEKARKELMDIRTELMLSD